MAKKPVKKAPAKTPVKKAAAKKAAAPPARKPAVKKPPRKKKKSSISCFTVLAAVFFFMIVAILAVSAVFVSLVSKYTRELPPLEQVVIPMPKEKTQMFAANGEVIAELYFENREYANSREIPDSIKLATIAIEDERFYRHRGVDVEGWGRALYRFAKTGGSDKQGASTISMQLARHIFLTGDSKKNLDYFDEQTGRFKVSIVRKLQEAILSISIEKKYSKDEILTHYINQIYYGHSAYGVKSAARVFFGKKLGQVTLEEAALLAAVPNAPSIFSPYSHPDNAIRRRKFVMDNMLRLHFISPGEYETAVRRPIKVIPLEGPAYENYKAPYFVTYVVDQLQDPKGPFNLVPEELFSRGYKIYTTLDLKLNRYAEDAIKHGMGLINERNANAKQAAIVSIEPQTGRIMAMVGGVDFKKYKFNRAWQAVRQPGSSFKPFVYITALKMGYPMESYVSDSPVCYPAFPERYCPKNFDMKFKGPMTLHTALQQSRNVPAVKVGRMVGTDNIIKTVRSMGITTNMHSVPSLPLGACEVTVLEMAAAYSVIANGGYYIEPVSVERITDSNGIVLYKKEYMPGKKVLDDNVVARIIPVMEDVVNAGTGTRARIGRPVAGKTGTTSDFRDAWFIGFTPQMTTTVWFGNDDNSPLRNIVKGKPTGAGVQGGQIPAPVWAHYMSKALKDKEIREFKLPKLIPMKVYKVEPATATESIEAGRTGAGQKGLLQPEAANFSGAQPSQAGEEDLQFVEPGNTGGEVPIEQEDSDLF